MRRRQVLKTLVAGGVAATAGCGDRADSTAWSQPTTPADDVPGEDDYGTVVDLVEEGADPTGEESIQPLLSEHAANDTLVYLGDGRFRLDQAWVGQDLDHFGLVGDAATLVPDKETYQMIVVGGSRNVHIAGLEFDFSGPGTGGRAVLLRGADGLELADVAVTGRFDEGPGPVRIDVTEADGQAVVERVALPDGGAEGTDVTGLYVGDTNQGDILFRDCRIEGFPDNGLYADPPAGEITVDGGYFANNGIASVRVKGGATVRDVHVRCDHRHREFVNMRGIRLTDYEARGDGEPATILDSRVELRDVTYSDGAIELDSRLAKLEVRDTHLQVDADGVNAIRAKAPAQTVADGSTPPQVTCKNVTVTGSAGDGAAVRIDNRSGCVFEDVWLYQSRGDRHGIELRRSNDNVVSGSVLDVGGDPIRLVDSTADVVRTIHKQSISSPFW